MSRRLLICDDDADIVEMLEIVLDDTAFEVITETDSKKVFQLIKDIKPDLVLMDLWMPVISGDQVLKQIRDSDDISNLPVVIMSAARDGREIAALAGADGYIAKPFNIDELLEKLNQTMG